MTVKERILERLMEERESLVVSAGPELDEISLRCRINRVLGLNIAQLIVMEEFAKEGEE